MCINEEPCDEFTIMERLRNELDELKDVFYNWSYYDTESLFYTIREKQAVLHNLELNMKQGQGNDT
ncbi:MAG: hypothetical protein Q8930_04250 [Bacillota bacterium]|nr:hypothetical protein [Bacillota bacterium]